MSRNFLREIVIVVITQSIGVSEEELSSE